MKARNGHVFYSCRPLVSIAFETQRHSGHRTKGGRLSVNDKNKRFDPNTTHAGMLSGLEIVRHAADERRLGWRQAVLLQDIRQALPLIRSSGFNSLKEVRDPESRCLLGKTPFLDGAEKEHPTPCRAAEAEKFERMREQLQALVVGQCARPVENQVAQHAG
jgi:hypothetical protein